MTALIAKDSFQCEGDRGNLDALIPQFASCRGACICRNSESKGVLATY